MESSNKQFVMIGVVILIVALLYVGNNFLSKIKAGDITLVPAGSQSAINPNSYAAVMPTSYGSPSQMWNSGNTNYNSGSQTSGIPPTNYYDVMQAQQASFGGLGNAFGSFAGSMF